MVPNDAFAYVLRNDDLENCVYACVDRDGFVGME